MTTELPTKEDFKRLYDLFVGDGTRLCPDKFWVDGETDEQLLAMEGTGTGTGEYIKESDGCGGFWYTRRKP
jgi:hypothetical protein